MAHKLLVKSHGRNNLAGILFGDYPKIWIMILVLFHKLDYMDYYCYGSISSTSTSTLLNNENGPLSEVQTATGLDVTLPCDLLPTAMSQTDKVQLVIWYKEGNAKPIYSFDARGKDLKEAVHWHDEDVLQSNAYFYYESSPPALRVKNIRKEDAGLYRCRVDFQKSPTKNCRINLHVLVPPTSITILNDHGASITNHIIGPYREGTTINITCMSSGGNPPPRVTWWKEHALVDDTFQEYPDGTVKNVLQIQRITREDLETAYTCQASNGHIVNPLSSKVILEMKLPPLYVNIQGLNHALNAGSKTHVTCVSAGARPAPEIIWMKGQHVLPGSTQSTSSNNNLTTSDIVYLATPEDNGEIISCSVRTDERSSPSISLKDQRTLDIRHAPIVTLSLGAPLDPKNLVKGSDVYLECDIKANPPIKKVEWYHSNNPLQSSRGVIITNQTLVLQSISKQTHGQYMCRATNAQGSVSSNDLYLDVKYPPVCNGQVKTVRAALKQTINITCDVDSNPMKNLTFKWSFNNTADNLIELPSNTNEPDNDNYVMHQQQKHSPQIDATSMYKTKNNYNSLEQQQHARQQHYNAKKYQHGSKQANYHNAHNSHNSMMQQASAAAADLGVYYFKVENFSSFGTVSCSAENAYGNSGNCLYNVVVADLPDPVTRCSAFNATAYSIQIACVPGFDGGIQQYFNVDVNDDVTRERIYNISFASPNFIIKKLPSDAKLMIKITSYNLQGTSTQSYDLRVKTLSAPTLRTASSRAVLVQITPLLGALVGVVVTLVLIAICIVIFVRFKKKKYKKSPVEGEPGEPDKGSCEPLSRNHGSHSSIDEKNPDVVPHDNSDDEYMNEEKQFERLYTPTKLNYVNNNSPTTTSPPIRFDKQYGELSLTTNPGYALYSTPLRAYNCIPSPTSQVTPIIRSKSPPNIYTRLPMKDYTTVIASPTTNMSNYGISHQQQLTSPNKHLLIATTPFMENGVPTSTTTVPALHSPYGQRMPLLNTNYATAINNRINNGNITNGVKSQLIITNVES